MVPTMGLAHIEITSVMSFAICSYSIWDTDLWWNAAIEKVN